MADEEAPQDLTERIRRIAATIAGEVDKRLVTDDESPSILDAAARSLGATMDRWGQNPSLRRLLGGVQRDVLTSPGERVELSATLGMASKLGTIARFYVDDAVVGEVPIGSTAEVRTMIDAPGPGLHRVGVKVCNDRGQVVSDLIGHRLLQVASGRPVALVHAALFLPRPTGDPTPPTSPLDALRALIDEGFEIVYFDIHDKNRDALIHDEVVNQRLPPGAILVYSAEEEELKSLGVHFVKMFAKMAIRRLRAKGVPVTTVLTERDDDSVESRAEQVSVITPSTVLKRAHAGAFGPEVEQATQLLRDKASSDPLDWRLDQTTESRLVSGNSFHAELDNEQARRRLFASFEEAVSTIHVQFYIVRAGDFTEHLIVKLIQRARAGVKVRFMVDALYSDEEVLGRLNPLILSLKEEENIEVLAVHPIESRREVGVSSLKKRDHRKLVIIDGRRAFVSGRNAGDEYFLGFDEVPVHDNTRHERIPWLDAHVELTGPLVRKVQETFVRTWHRQGGGKIPEDQDVLPKLEPAGSAAGRLVVHRGLADTNGLAMYETMFDLAEDHVYIVNDFPFVPTLERAIFRLLDRGVTVKLLTGNAATRRDDGTFFPAPLHRTLFEYMVKAKLEPLLTAGVEVYEFVPSPSPKIVARGGRIRPYVHAKLVSVDGLVTSIGSANLDATASFWESEANIVVQDADFASGIEATVQKMIDDSVRLDPESEYWKRERAQRAVVATLWPGTFYS
ncbi:MAG: phosphatidylserine/phosphatidylglycerophosphate/cardiolipin synthase family protein [Myxococcales bacterium]|nr:phosphatidylserine/phosphatidylglycerophosphate/cardiolipin synthase family protein [Myxococcales bacterium]MDH3482962.1 phosphatidylserine/phosphatidylglycerophosphate/cardiolipin synthase family protein [Myxococcales bacterium]